MKTILTLTLSLSLFSPLGAIVTRAADQAPAKPAVPPVPPVPAVPPAAPSNPISAERRAEMMQKQAEMLKNYDKNGNGKLEQEEIVLMQKDRQDELLKKYDKNANGKMDDDEREAYRGDMRKQREEMLNKRRGELGKPAAKPEAPKEEKKEDKK